jgi:hypothetical protein
LWGRSRPSQGGSASAAQAGGLRKGDETAWRRDWCGNGNRGYFTSSLYSQSAAASTAAS